MTIQHELKICAGAACYVKSGNTLYNYAMQNCPANISVERVQCVGSCSGAPVIVFDGNIISQATTNTIRDLFLAHGSYDGSVMKKECPSCNNEISQHQTVCEHCGWKFNYGETAPLSNKLATVDFCRRLQGQSLEDSSYVDWEYVGSGTMSLGTYSKTAYISGGFVKPLDGVCQKLNNVSVTWDGWTAQDDFSKKLKINARFEITIACRSNIKSWSNTNQQVMLLLSSGVSAPSSPTDTAVITYAYVPVNLEASLNDNGNSKTSYFETELFVPYGESSIAESFNGSLWLYCDPMYVNNARNIEYNIIDSDYTYTDISATGAWSANVIKKITQQSSSTSTSSNYGPAMVINYDAAVLDDKFVIADTDRYISSRCVQERHLVYKNQKHRMSIKGWTGEFSDSDIIGLYGNVNDTKSYSVSAVLKTPDGVSPIGIYTNVDQTLSKVECGNPIISSGTLASEMAKTYPYVNVDVSISVPRTYYKDRHIADTLYGSVQGRSIKFPIYINGDEYFIDGPYDQAVNSLHNSYDMFIAARTLSSTFRVPSIRATEGGLQKYANYVVEMGKPEINMDLGPGVEYMYVSGVVTDLSGNPLQGVNISVKDRTNPNLGDELLRCQTDMNGNYTIKVTFTEFNSGKLSFTKFGYTTRTISISSRNFVNCTLATDVSIPNYNFYIFPASQTVNFTSTDGNTKSVQLTPNLEKYENGIYQGTIDVERSCTWTSSNTSIATVSSTGTVTVHRQAATRQVTITASYTNGDNIYMAQSVITVTNSIGEGEIEPGNPLLPDTPEIIL